MRFEGFTEQDFDLFSIADFAGRMAEIRATLRPKLVALGDDLTGAIEEELGAPTFPHVAQHMRRRVNPPAETWVAFGRDKKGYKRWTHYRVAVSGSGVRVTVFVEDDADDKAPFGTCLADSADGLLKALGPQAPVQWYTFGTAGMPHSQVTAEVLRAQGSALQRLKTLKFQAGVPLTRAEALKMAPEAFETWAMEQVRVLKPLYLAGTGQE